MITFATPNHHWNYFLAIEKDLDTVSKYIEFCDDNLKTYSIALTHILLSASSEVDVVMKQLCALIDESNKIKNIDQYRMVIKDKLPRFIYEEVKISRVGMVLKPWDNWLGDVNPDWGKSHTDVKHQRNVYFKEANLKNTLNAVGSLLISIIYYYKYAFSKETGQEITFKDTTRQLEPKSILMEMNSTYYYDTIIV